MYIGDARTGNTNESYGDTSVYAGALDSVAPGLSVTVAENQAPGESWVDSLARLLPTLVLADSQRRLLNVQLDRASKGLAPLNTSQYGVGVNVGLSPQTLLIGGAVLLALVFIATRRR